MLDIYRAKQGLSKFRVAVVFSFIANYAFQKLIMFKYRVFQCRFLHAHKDVLKVYQKHILLYVIPEQRSTTQVVFVNVMLIYNACIPNQITAAFSLHCMSQGCINYLFLNTQPTIQGFIMRLQKCKSQTLTFFKETTNGELIQNI